MIDKSILRIRQQLPLELKERLSEQRIKSWYDYWQGNVYVSFSGGKDSTVLLDLVRRFYNHVPAVFVDTGLEYPEIRQFVKTIDNVVWLKPKMRFNEVIDKYGYPVISKEIAQKIYEIRNTKSEKLRNKRLFGDLNGNGKLPEKWKYLINAPFKIHSWCCHALKKNPIMKYEKETKKKPIVGMLAEESRNRKTSYLKNGCNTFNSSRPMSLPLAFWTKKDIWGHIKKYNLSYSKIYDMGEDRTGCMFCIFGVHLDGNDNKFTRMKQSHPKQWDYCINKLKCKQVLDYIGVKYK